MKKQIKVEVSEKEYSRLCRLADDSGLSLAAIARRALSRYDGRMTRAEVKRIVRMAEAMPCPFDPRDDRYSNGYCDADFRNAVDESDLELVQTESELIF